MGYPVPLLIDSAYVANDSPDIRRTKMEVAGGRLGIIHVARHEAWGATDALQDAAMEPVTAYRQGSSFSFSTRA